MVSAGHPCCCGLILPCQERVLAGILLSQDVEESTQADTQHTPLHLTQQMPLKPVGNLKPVGSLWA
jgi:hypothetical protein